MTKASILRWIGLLPLLAALSSEGLAHGTPVPQRGGVVNYAGDDYNFELVQKGADALIYIDDHGSAFPLQGTLAWATLMHGNSKTKANAKTAGESTLSVKGLQPRKGDLMLLEIQMPDKRLITAWFKF